VPFSSFRICCTACTDAVQESCQYYDTHVTSQKFLFRFLQLQLLERHVSEVKTESENNGV